MDSQPMDPAPETSTASSTEVARRGFFTQASAAVIGGLVGLVPVVSGVLFFLSPLKWGLDPSRKKKATGGDNGSDGFTKVASLDSVPADGSPLRVSVIADRWDAWNFFPNELIGACYLRRKEDGEVTAFNVICPHLGCSVDYKPGAGNFHCPCHDSSFSIDGEPKNETPPRGLDTLEVDAEKLKNGEVWVKYQDFRTGEHEKIPKA